LCQIKDVKSFIRLIPGEDFLASFAGVGELEAALGALPGSHKVEVDGLLVSMLK
jgi:hypothetical protein